MDHKGGREGHDVGTALVELREIASDVARRCAQADAEERLDYESESLVRWAEKRNCLIEPSLFKRLTQHLRVFEGGVEHRVIFVPERGRVLKTTKPPGFGCRGTLLDYVNNIIWSNWLFEDDIVLVGVLQSEDSVSLVVSQPFIVGKAPTQAEIAEWFEMQGYRRDGFNKWARDEDGILIADAHEGNFIVMANGYMIPIDLQVLNPGRLFLSELGRG